MISDREVLENTSFLRVGEMVQGLIGKRCSSLRAHGIVSDVEVIPAKRINEAYERAPRGDVHYRFVIGAATLGAD